MLLLTFFIHSFIRSFVHSFIDCLFVCLFVCLYYSALNKHSTECLSAQTASRSRPLPSRETRSRRSPLPTMSRHGNPNHCSRTDCAYGRTCDSRRCLLRDGGEEGSIPHHPRRTAGLLCRHEWGNCRARDVRQRRGRYICGRIESLAPDCTVSQARSCRVEGVTKVYYLQFVPMKRMYASGISLI